MHLMLRRAPAQIQASLAPCTAGSRNRHLAELRSFFRYLKKAGKLLSNPSLELERARETKRLPKAILTIPEMARLLQVIPKDSPTGLRDWAAVELLYGSGIRRAELLRLELTDLRLSEELVHVLGKGDRERVVPIGKAAYKALERYLREGRPQLVTRRASLSLGVLLSRRAGERPGACALHSRTRPRAGIKKRHRFSPVSAHLRNSSPERWSRFALDPDLTWPRRSQHHGHLYPRGDLRPEKDHVEVPPP